MNYLAHLLLASHNEAALLGAFLGDFVKGAPPLELAPEIRQEIAVHRHIDSLTDAHPEVRAGLRHFAAPRRRFAGIALDLFYDHVLARDWARYSSLSLTCFTGRVYAALQRHEALLPAAARHTAQRMIEQDWLTAYAQFDAIEQALHRIGQRLSRGGEHLPACVRELRLHDQHLAAGLPRLLADLRIGAGRKRASLA